MIIKRRCFLWRLLHAYLLVTIHMWAPSWWCQLINYHRQYSRLKSSMPFKCDLALQNISLSKQPSKMQPQIENEDVTWSLQYNMPGTRINKRRAFSIQEVELDGWFWILHIVLETCTMYFMNKFSMSFVFHFYIPGLMSWIWTNPLTEELKFESPSQWNSYEGFNLEHWSTASGTSSCDTHRIRD